LTPVAGVVGERLVFQASVGFCLLLITLLLPFIPIISEFKLKQFTTKPFIYSLPILIICVFYIWNRNGQWYNKLSLFEHDILYTENSAKANSMLANEYFEMLSGVSSERKYPPEVLAQKAIKHYNAAVAADSSFFTAYNNAGVIFFSNLNDITAAKRYFSLAIHHKDKYAQAYENLGNCYKKDGNLKEAFKYYKLAIESNNKHYSGYTSLLGLLMDKKQYAISAKVSQMALTVFPSDYYLLIYLANSYLLGNEKEKAFTVFEEAYLINPTNELRQFLDKEKLNK
jgi:tetratricopeptide (TPR) repeat protein